MKNRFAVLLAAAVIFSTAFGAVSTASFAADATEITSTEYAARTEPEKQEAVTESDEKNEDSGTAVSDSRDSTADEMPTNQWVYDEGYWYYYGSEGYLVDGWIHLGSTWYYLEPDYNRDTFKSMATGWRRIGGQWYYFNSSGAMATGWKKVGGSWYYLNSSGAMATGWKKISGKWYYFNSSGAMAANRWVGNYYVESSGAMATNKWIGNYHVGSDGKWDKTWVYWIDSGSVYHKTPNCPTLRRSTHTIHSGTIAQSGKSRACKDCF